MMTCSPVCSYDYQTLDYDIMLIKLYHPVEVTDAVAPISLPTGCPYAGLPCFVSGWGNTALEGDRELCRLCDFAGGAHGIQTCLDGCLCLCLLELFVLTCVFCSDPYSGDARPAAVSGFACDRRRRV